MPFIERVHVECPYMALTLDNKVFCFIEFTGLPVPPSHKMGFQSSAAKNGLPGEGRHQGLVRRNDVLTNGFT